MIYEHLIACGDTLELIKQVEPASIDLLVTSPPYWAKRVYNGEGEIGSEETPEAYVSRLADFFDELRPYLKPTANIFINLGDTYFGSGAGAWSKYLDNEGNITQLKRNVKRSILQLNRFNRKSNKMGSYTKTSNFCSFLLGLPLKCRSEVGCCVTILFGRSLIGFLPVLLIALITHMNMYSILYSTRSISSTWMQSKFLVQMAT